MQIGLPTIRRGIVAFWAIWFTIVFASNLFDGLVQLRILPLSWGFY